MTYVELQDIKLVSELPYNWKKLDNKTILISGGTGFIGSFIIEIIKYRNLNFNSNIKVVSISRSGGDSNNTVEYLKADISAPVCYDGKVDYIIHLASNTHPKQYEEDPVGTIITNIYGSDNLLKLAKEKNAVFLLASSVEIYGQGSDKPMDEKYFGYLDCNNARNGYNEAKRLCESLCQSYKEQFGVDVRIARLSRIFGADKKKDSKAIAQFMNNVICGEDIVLKSKGEQRFSYCYVADAASGILKILIDGISGEAYNISADDEGMTLGEYAKYIGSLGGRKVIYNIENNKYVSKATYALVDTNKIKALNWKPIFTIKDALYRTYKIYIDYVNN